VGIPVEARVAVGTCMMANETKPNTYTCTVPYLYSKYHHFSERERKRKNTGTGKYDRTIHAVLNSTETDPKQNSFNSAGRDRQTLLEP